MRVTCAHPELKIGIHRIEYILHPKKLTVANPMASQFLGFYPVPDSPVRDMQNLADFRHLQEFVIALFS